MAALDEHGFRASRMQKRGGAARAFSIRRDSKIRQACRFGKIRRDEGCEWKEVLDNRFACIGCAQSIAARRDEHRIEDDEAGLIKREPFRDRRDDSGRGEHPDLDGGDIDVFENCVDLRPGKTRERDVHGSDPLRILRGQGGEDGHAVAAKRGKGLQIRRDARAPAWIKTRYREKILDHVPASRRTATPAAPAPSCCGRTATPTPHSFVLTPASTSAAICWLKPSRSEQRDCCQ